MLYYERKFKKQGFDIIIGVDEAGRGPLAGPIVAAAVSLIKYRFKNRIDDSKRLTPKQREEAFLEISDKAIFGLGIINESVIDNLNIQRANCLSMQIAIDNLIEKLNQKALLAHKQNNIHLLVDGNINIDSDYSTSNIIKGDMKSKSIACASIVAKVIRDRIMNLYDKIYPAYGFRQHKGYPTYIHRSKLGALGLTPIHRKSFSYVEAKA